MKLAIGWAAAWIALAILTAVIVGPWMDFYAATGIELAYITHIAVGCGQALRSPLGWVVVAALLALGLLPHHVGVGGEEHRRWLTLGIVQAGLAALLLWAALELPLMPLQPLFQTEADHLAYLARFPRPPLVAAMGSARITTLAIPLLTLLQVAAWIKLSVRVFHLPRVRLQEEALRAIVVALLPGLGVAWCAHQLVDDRHASTGLVVAPAFAAAGTAFLIAYGAALWLRLRQPAEA